MFAAVKGASFCKRLMASRSVDLLTITGHDLEMFRVRIMLS